MVEKPVPLYVQAANDLRAKIKNGVYPPGSVLPSSPELRQRYLIGSDGTLNQVYKILKAEGLIRRNAAVGMIVQDPNPPIMDLILHNPHGHGPLPWSECCKLAGLDGRMVTDAVRDPEPADADVAELLGLDDAAHVVQRDRHATIGEQTVRLDEAYYPAELVERTPIATERKVPGGIYATLAAAGHAPAVVARRTVGARLASEEEAKRLKLAAGAYVLTADQVIADGRGRAIELLRIVANPARVQFSEKNMSM
ncbi:GntR family transcriptional regulator [Nonomuraea sp. SYSU D8015]|uniref:GntR family transcriptional regulator n=1 Tax=Nonomuraea sp. SYSU D8015 TaxID=2593644 RepID=UPI0016604C31|nr:GntR family transcriptional regulator [Nonomuraea sp. SYSU D8015]